MIAVDSSLTIAAAAPSHVAHEQAVAALSSQPAALIAHVAFETTSALSRMPLGRRLAPAVVLEWLARSFQDPWLALPGPQAQHALQTAVAAGIRGGALYDALIAGTALHFGHALLSADRRAERVYAALGADVVFVETSG